MILGLIRHLSVITILATFSVGAQAQFVSFGSVDANIAIDTGDNDPGTFDTIALGDDITLDGCYSTFVNDGASSGGSWCYADPSTDPLLPEVIVTGGAIFDWTLVNEQTLQSTSFNGNSVPLSTGGVSDFINVAGTYSLTLTITSAFFDEISLSPVGDLGVQSGGIFGTETRGFSVTSVASVPEPSALLLMAPGLFYVVRRQRRRRQRGAE